MIAAAIAVVVGVPLVVFALVPDFSLPWGAADEKPLMVAVRRGDFVHELTERGDVESASNVEIICEVESQNSSGATILDIVPEGTWVEEGDIVCTLDSSALEDQYTKQEIAVANAKAALIQAQNAYDTAVIAKKEYLEGQYRQQYLSAQINVFVAEENKRRAEDYLKYSQSLAQKGYITQAQLEADQFALEKAVKELESAVTALEVLEQFTKPKMVRQLDADIETAKAKLESQQHAYDLEVEQLEYIKEQIDKCTIRAPAAGQVVYANRVGVRGQNDIIIEPGARVRERQTIVRLPNPAEMQVKTKVNESKIGLVHVGTPAIIRVDALDGAEMEGEVVEVGKYPMPTSWFNSNVKEYETVVRIKQPVEGLRAGLTAEVRIIAERYEDVLMVPVHTVFEHRGQTWCITYENGKLKPVPVEIGSTNDKVVIIKSGLNEGDEVVQNAAAYREKVGMAEVHSREDEASQTGADASGSRSGGEESGEAGGPRGRRPGEGGTPQAAGEGGRRPGGGPGGFDPAAIVDRIFATLDANNNGKIDADEIPADRRDEMLKNDSDGDGAISKAEMQAGIAARGGGRPGGNGPRAGDGN
ncbi:hypothetical protein JCM19992_34450 [Thermostilla marina]